MAVQTIQIVGQSGLSSATIKAIPENTDSSPVSVSATPGINDPSLYAGAFTDLASGRYRIVLFSGSTPMASDHVEVTDTTATFPVEGLQQKSTAAVVDAIGGIVSLIKAVTDLLPNAGALSSLAAAADLATIDGKVDGIKAVTDLLPDSGALSSLLTALATIDTVVEQCDFYDDNEVEFL